LANVTRKRATERLSANGGGRSAGRRPGAVGYIRGGAPEKREEGCAAAGAGLTPGRLICYKLNAAIDILLG